MAKAMSVAKTRYNGLAVCQSRKRGTFVILQEINNQTPVMQCHAMPCRTQHHPLKANRVRVS
jgi:hypothetical protein